MLPLVKRCKVCEEDKPLDDFYGSKLGRDGVRRDNCEHGAQQRSVSDHDYSVIRI